MAHFCLLKDPDVYVADDWDMAGRPESREHWLGLFDAHFAETLQLARRRLVESAEPRIAAAGKEFHEWIGRLRIDPRALPGGKLTGIALDRMRERIGWWKWWFVDTNFDGGLDRAEVEAMFSGD